MVERPASVVKELLENALDAHCRSVQIDIERGGSSLIRVMDDGDGISREDLSLAVSRHATSKIHSLKELECIQSLGFRGEALASISAVSKLSIQSKPADQEQAWMIDTGTDTDFANYQAQAQLVSHPDGTTIEVRDLFFNTPARRKFLRTVKTEFKHIDDIVRRIALSQFDIAFKLSHNKKIIRNLPRAVTDKAIAQRIGKLYSSDFLDHASQVDLSSNDFGPMGAIRLHGWVSQPNWYRNQADWQYFYVNGRFIKDKLINHALRLAYQELLPTDACAAYLLYLEIDPEQVDVNVHPTKHEVRFRQARMVHDFIYSAISQSLGTSLPTVETEKTRLQASEPATGTQSYVNPYRPSGSGGTTSSSLMTHTVDNRVAERIEGLQKLYQVDKKQVSHAKSVQKTAADNLFGQPVTWLGKSYLLSQKSDDKGNKRQYAIHYLRAQQYLLEYLFRVSARVPLLIPQTLSLPADAFEDLLPYQALLNEWGLDINQISQQTLVIRSLPSVSQVPGCQLDGERLVQHLLMRIRRSTVGDTLTLIDDFIPILVQSLVSHSLSEIEQQQLLEELSRLWMSSGTQDNIRVQGKKIWLELDETLIRQWF